jgi:serine protease AprX
MFSFSESSNWWIFFNDKSCSETIQLSQKSIDRRLNQNIPFDYYDIPICKEYVNILKTHNIHVRNQSKWLNAISVSVDSISVLGDLLGYDFVKSIQPVATMKRQREDLEIALYLEMSDQFRNSSILPYGPSFNQIDMVGGVDLHNLGFLGNNMLIAIFDAGFFGVETLPVFQNLWNNNQILDMYDFVDNDNDVFGGSTHGTMVLSTMGGYIVDSLIGTAPEAKYMLFRTEDSGSETLIEEDNWAAAAEYADSVGVNIINSSLGYTILYDDTLNSHSYIDMDGNSTIITIAADLAASRGILVVNSAGNSGNNDWYYIGAPADGDSVLSVGAVNNIGQIASFSSRGPSSDGRIKPNVCAQGLNTVVADMDSTIRLASGTSFSSPIIAGLSACLWGALETNNIDVNNMQIFDLIQESAHVFNSPNDSLGYGIPNFHQAYLNGILFEQEKDFIFEVFPNPFEEAFNFFNSSNIEFQIDIFNIMGLCLLSKQIYSGNNYVDFSHIDSGVYFIKIRGGMVFYPIVKI